MLRITDILTAYGKIGVDLTKQTLEASRATGKTIDSVRYEVSDNDNKERLVIKARPFTSALETGVKPVSAGSKPGIPPEMIENFTEYARARGMDNPESAAWAMAKKIKQVGDKTYRMGGKDVYSDAMEGLAKEITKAITKEFIRESKTIIIPVK
jgi:hypothetical protein